MDVLSADGHKRQPFVVGTEKEIFEYLRAEQQKHLGERETAIYEYIDPKNPAYPTRDIDWYLIVEEVTDGAWIVAKQKSFIEKFTKLSKMYI